MDVRLNLPDRSPYLIFSDFTLHSTAAAWDSLKRTAARIANLIVDNRSLILWTSSSVMIATAPGVFLGGAALGMASASLDHLGLLSVDVKPFSWDALQWTADCTAFITAVVVHYFIQIFWGGVLAGAYLYNLWHGQIHLGQYRWQALDFELGHLTRQISNWLLP